MIELYHKASLIGLPNIAAYAYQDVHVWSALRPACAPPPPGGPKSLRGPDHCPSQYGEIAWHRKRQKLLVPRLKGLGEPVTPCVETQNAQVFLGIFPRPP